MRRPASPQTDLFGKLVAAPKDQTPVRVRLDVIAASCTAKAWFLRPPGKGAKAGFAPRSEARPGDGPEAQFFTMPKWLARERGWL